MIIGNGLSQMFAVAKLADMVNRVKPEGPRQRETRPAGLQISGFRNVLRGNPAHSHQLFQPPGADPHAGWCGRGGVERLPPIPIRCPAAIRRL